MVHLCLKARYWCYFKLLTCPYASWKDGCWCAPASPLQHDFLSQRNKETPLARCSYYLYIPAVVSTSSLAAEHWWRPLEIRYELKGPRCRAIEMLPLVTLNATDTQYRQVKSCVPFLSSLSTGLCKGTFCKGTTFPAFSTAPKYLCAPTEEPTDSTQYGTPPPHSKRTHLIQ